MICSLKICECVQKCVISTLWWLHLPTIFFQFDSNTFYDSFGELIAQNNPLVFTSPVEYVDFTKKIGIWELEEIILENMPLFFPTMLVSLAMRKCASSLHIPHLRGLDSWVEYKVFYFIALATARRARKDVGPEV